MNILAIESSCDETAAAIVNNGTTIVSSVVASSSEMHQKYGGIVPEIAAREQVKVIIPVIKESLEKAELTIDSIDQIAVTVGPGLIGSLLVGVETAKTMAFVTKKPIIPVNHVIAHIYANFLEPSSVIPGLTGNPSSHPTMDPRLCGDDNRDRQIEFPAISLVVSGGHTELFLMKSIRDVTWLGGTIDDAAGEAFDKTGRLLGFGNGGGAAIQKASQQSNKLTKQQFNIKLPRPLMDQSLNFSFSGLKTAVVREWKKFDTHNELLINSFAHEIQEAITDVLVAKTLHACALHSAKSILLGGGVAVNQCLREKFFSKLKTLNSKLSFFAPDPKLCTDNAAYIGAYAFFKGSPVDWHVITAVPDLSVETSV